VESKPNGPGPFAVAGAIATWLAIALSLHAQTTLKLQELGTELQATRVSVEHRLTKLETKLDALSHRTRVKLAFR
jgi:hypothetical protein